MAKMLSKLHWGNRSCDYKKDGHCCRHPLFYKHGGRQNPRVRKAQRAHDKALWKRGDHDS